MLRRTVLTLAILAGITSVLPAAAQQGAPNMPTPTRSGYAPVNGVEVFYQTFGTGKPLVILHGGLESGDGFAPIIPALAANREVIAVDLQGHGRTRPFDRPMTFPNLATDVAELIGWLGHDKADLLGYSLGGLTALRTAIDHPAVVDRLVIVSAPFAFAGWHDYNQQGMRSISAALAEDMKASPMYQNYERLSPDPSLWGRTLDQTGALVGADFDWSAEVPGIKSPTLLVYGDYDAIRTSHIAQFFELLGGGKADGGWQGENMTPNRLAILQGALHYFMYNEPRLAEEVLRFLDQ